MSNIPLTERHKWMGASESAALFGASPFNTAFELWQYKAGIIQPDSLDDVERIQAGQFLEPSIGKWASFKWDWPINNVTGYTQHAHIKQMGASLDFETTDTRDAVEIKNVDYIRFRDGDWVSEGDTIYDCPLHYLIQVQHQLACSPHAECGWLVVCISGNQLKRMRIDRSPEMIDAIEGEVNQFWESIREGNPPPPDFSRDTAVLNKLFGGKEAVQDLSHDTDAANVVAEWAAAHAIERDAKARKEAAMNKIKVMSGDCITTLFDDNWTMKASHIKASVREVGEHWRFNLRQKKA